jgi:putative PIN family toxin of toxin-antitoxin system
MIRAVVDLTEMVRAARQRPERSLLVRQWEASAFVWVTSRELLAQFERAATGRDLARRIRPWARDAPIDKLVADAVIVMPASDAPRCRDPKDDVVIATAVAAHADFIVTADDDLHDPPLAARLRDEWNIRVVHLGEFLVALERQ